MPPNLLSGAMRRRGASAPIVLSSALCRPTSSRTKTIAPSTSAPGRGVDGARGLIENPLRLKFAKGRADRVRGDRSRPLERRTRRRHLGKIFDATQAAAGAPAHRPAAREMRLQSLAGNRDLELPAVLDGFDLISHEYRRRFRRFVRSKQSHTRNRRDRLASPS